MNTRSRSDRAPILDSVVVDRAARASLQKQLCDEMKRLIHGGRWRPGQRLPSTRSLAEDLGLSRNTVTAAYDRLIGEGYLEAKPRSALFVAAAVVGGASPRTRRRPSPALLVDATLPVDRTLPVDATLPALAAAPRPFRPCQPDVRLFPVRLWNRLRGRRIRTDGPALFMYQSELTLGLPALRQAIAEYLRQSRGVRCDWRQVAITTGSQQALYLLAQALLGRDARVLVEDPGYPGARHAWASRGARIEPVPVDEQGCVPPADCVPASPTLIYMTPSRQFPTGACLPVARRLAWLALARRADAWVVEDDYDSEFRYGRAPMPSLHGLDTSGRVIYVGSMSKVLFPSLRIGYAVLPATLVDRFAALRSVVDDHGPLIDQATLAAFIESGAFFTHIRRCRRHYGERQRVFLERARSVGLPFDFAHADGGMNLLGRLPAGTDEGRLGRLMSDAGFDIPTLAAYSLRPQPLPGFVFGFSAFTVSELERHLTNLARALGRPDRRSRSAG
ncbi:MAG: PLP-dependent aminotransferase family protein [Vicinamibacterales bacterium]